MKTKFKKRLLYTLYLLVITPVLFELALRIVGYKAFYFTPYQLSSQPQECLFADEKLGIGLTPGSFKVTINKGLHYTTTHTATGNRTSRPTKSIDSLPVIALFGCSYTYGMGVNDKEVMSALLHQQLPGVTVVNYGVPGYGNVQGFLQLKQLVQQGQKPKMAIFNFADFHLERNVLAPTYRCQLKIGFLHTQDEFKAKMKLGYFPAVCLVNDSLKFQQYNWTTLYENWIGRETFALINFLQTGIEKGQTKKLDIKKTSLKLFQHIYQFCQQHDIQFVVTALTKNQRTHDFIQQLQHNHIPTLDMSLPLEQKAYNHMPYDSHPNQKAHAYYASQIKFFIQRLNQ